MLSVSVFKCGKWRRRDRQERFEVYVTGHTTFEFKSYAQAKALARRIRRALGKKR